MLLALCPAHASDDKEQSFGMNIKNRQSRRKVAVGMLGMLTVFGIEVTATAAAPDLAHPFNIHPMHARGHAVVQIAPAFQKEEGYNVCPPEVIANLPVQVEWFHTLGEDLLELTTSHGAVLIYARRAKTSPSTPELVTLWEKGSPYLRSIYPSVVSGVDTFYALFMPSCLAFTRRDEHGKPSPPEVIDVINTTTGTTYRGLLRQGIDPGIPGAEPQKTVLELTMNRQGQIVYLAVLDESKYTGSNIQRTWRTPHYQLFIESYVPTIANLPATYRCVIWDVPPSYAPKLIERLSKQTTVPLTQAVPLNDLIALGDDMVQHTLPALLYEVRYEQVEPLPLQRSLKDLAEQRSKGMRLRTKPALAQLKLPEEAAAKSPYRAPKSASRSFLERWGLALGIACLAAAATTAAVLFIRRKE